MQIKSSIWNGHFSDFQQNTSYFQEISNFLGWTWLRNLGLGTLAGADGFGRLQCCGGLRLKYEGGLQLGGSIVWGHRLRIGPLFREKRLLTRTNTLKNLKNCECKLRAQFERVIFRIFKKNTPYFREICSFFLFVALYSCLGVHIFEKKLRVQIESSIWEGHFSDFQKKYVIFSRNMQFFFVRRTL